jgi:DNA polymerase (family 10)
VITSVVALLEGTPGLHSIEPAGSFRRRRETIGDIDLLAETDDPQALIERFTGLGLVDEVIGRGGHKSAIRIFRGPQVDLMAMPPGEAGAYLLHFTGSKEHNVKLRAIARDQGWSLSEYGFLRIDENGEPLTGDAAELRTFATEQEAYAFLGPRLDRARAARGHGRDRGRPVGPAAEPDHAGRPKRRLPLPTPSGATATSRSR